MSSYLRPRRGKEATAIAQLTASNPLKRGEIFFEVPDDGVGTGSGRLKMGDGVTAYEDLPYFMEPGSPNTGIAEDVTISLPSTGWSTETIDGTTHYTQTAVCAGMSSSKHPVIVPVFTTDSQITEYNKILRFTCGSNSVKFICTTAPSVNLTVVVKMALETSADLSQITTQLSTISGQITQLNNDLAVNTSKYYYCDSSASSQYKDITIDGVSSLTAGMRITVYFANSNTYTGSCYLRINNSLSNYIYTNVNGSNYGHRLLRGPITLTFDGTYWRPEGTEAKLTYNGYPYYRLNFSLSGDTLTITPYTSL